ncbi:MAG: IS21-like element helper ATPase IstB [Syntrophus sp. (in: bacteria)]
MIMTDSLKTLQLTWSLENYETLAAEASRKHWSHVEYLERLIEGEAAQRLNNRVVRRIKQARFPVLKTLDQFDWSWPKKINRELVQNLFRLTFLNDHTNVILIGGVGLGKTHLATALGYEACQKGLSVLFSTAVEIINTLTAAQVTHRLKAELRRYTAPALLVVDEIGYLPVDKQGADLLFQVISQRYERGSMIITTNKVYKHWPSIFNNDSGLTSAVLDRLLHHEETVLIDGPSYRTKEKKPEL